MIVVEVVSFVWTGTDISQSSELIYTLISIIEHEQTHTRATLQSTIAALRLSSSSAIFLQLKKSFFDDLKT